MSKNDGGSAFPVSVEQSAKGVFPESGMTLRDYFAAKAMQAMISERVLINGIAHKVPPLAYAFADAMIAEKSKP